MWIPDLLWIEMTPREKEREPQTALKERKKGKVTPPPPASMVEVDQWIARKFLLKSLRLRYLPCDEDVIQLDLMMPVIFDPGLQQGIDMGGCR